MFSNQDILHIKALVTSKDINNNLIAFALIKDKPLVSELLTPLYLLYSRFILSNHKSEKRKALKLLQNYVNSRYKGPAGLKINIVCLFEDEQYTYRKNIHHGFKALDKLVQFDKAFIASAIPNYIEQRYWGKSLSGFVFRYSPPEQHKDLVHLVKIKTYTNLWRLDLGGMEFGDVPDIVFQDPQLEILAIWGNALQQLPNRFEALPNLIRLHLANNQLERLPSSIQQLHKLEQLFAQNNPLQVTPLINTLKTLPKLKRLDLSVNHLSPEEANKLLSFQYLINSQKLLDSPKAKALLLFLLLQDPTAQEELTYIDFFWGANHDVEEIRMKALAYIYEHFNNKAPLTSGCSITLLGKMSQQINLHFEALQKQLLQRNIPHTATITSQTTHIVLGEYPEDYEALEGRNFTFLTEQDLLDYLSSSS